MIYTLDDDTKDLLKAFSDSLDLVRNAIDDYIEFHDDDRMKMLNASVGHFMAYFQILSYHEIINKYRVTNHTEEYLKFILDEKMHTGFDNTIKFILERIVDSKSTTVVNANTDQRLTPQTPSITNTQLTREMIDIKSNLESLVKRLSQTLGI